MIRAAIQGTAGSYSEDAALKIYGAVQIVQYSTFQAAIDAVVGREADTAVLPIENRIAGRLAAVEKLLSDDRLSVIGRIRVTIDHVLIGSPTATLENQRSVVSHPIALQQCSGFLARSGLKAVSGADTAACVRDAVRNSDGSRSAIGSRRAAELYGGKILQENISDEEDNWTDFVSVSL